MFLYWDGYEIDGSDTDFDIILPENVQAHEFAQCFLDIPIFCEKRKPIFGAKATYKYQRGYISPDKKITEADFKSRLLSGDYSSMSIVVSCQHPEQLPPELSAQIHNLSKTRNPQETAYGKPTNPCTGPPGKWPFMSVDLTFEKITKDWNESYFEGRLYEDSYSYNLSLIAPVKKGDTIVTLGIPVSSNYEYAMYIIKHMESHFPSISIWGGEECSCGATFGCSLYEYEKLHLPIKYSINNTLKRLSEYGILRSYRTYYAKGRKIEFTNSGFYLTSDQQYYHTPPEKELPFSEYLTLVDMTLQESLTPYQQVAETAAHLHLPPPDFYAANPQVQKILEEELEKAVPKKERESWYTQDWLYTGYIAILEADAKPECEIRVRYRMKQYLQTLLNLADVGMLDFIKPTTYEKRKN